MVAGDGESPVKDPNQVVFEFLYNQTILNIPVSTYQISKGTNIPKGDVEGALKELDPVLKSELKQIDECGCGRNFSRFVYLIDKEKIETLGIFVDAYRELQKKK